MSLPECLLLAAYYLAYMGTTIWMSRGQEPVHADPRLHEVPHRPPPMDSFFKGGFTATNRMVHESEDPGKKHYIHRQRLRPMDSFFKGGNRCSSGTT